jgi:hypothetical protein
LRIGRWSRAALWLPLIRLKERGKPASVGEVARRDAAVIQHDPPCHSPARKANAIPLSI